MGAELLGSGVETVPSSQERRVEFKGPLGATLVDGGCTVAVMVGQNASSVTCEVVSPDLSRIIGNWELVADTTNPDQAQPEQVFSQFLPGVPEGSLYTYQVSGRNIFNPQEIDRTVPPFDIYDGSSKLIDPRAHAVHQEGNQWYGVVVDENFRWGRDKPPKHQDRLICELHVKGATKLFEKIPETLRGTYAGMAMLAPLLKEMGYTHAELMPIFQFEPVKDVLGKPTNNYWGYDPLNFFSPNEAYSSDKTPGGSVKEFKSMVKEFHRNGIGVILDVVYNHTGEAGIAGPALSFKGIDNDGYYMYQHNTNPIDTNGCATNFDASSAQGQSLVLDSLKYWSDVMHVDGFRFDLAPTVVREKRLEGGIDTDNFATIPIIQAIDREPALKNTILIAEPWDMQGYIHGKTGYFAGTGKWQEWNGFYRDDLRNIIRGQGRISTLAHLLVGMNMPEGSVNFLTAHDGFTARDLVSYDIKNNEANGEHNRDGETHNNCSYNHGYEGETDDPAIIDARLRAIRNGMAILLASNGAVMIPGGDNLLHTQGGNNNAYNQDNPTSWLPWDRLTPSQIMHRKIIAANIIYRRAHPQFFAANSPKRRYIDGTLFRKGDHEWLGENGSPKDSEFEWRENENKVVGLFRSAAKFGSRVDDSITYHNVGYVPTDVVLPQDKAFRDMYTVVIDTARAIAHTDARLEEIVRNSFTLDALSTVVLRRRKS